MNRPTENELEQLPLQYRLSYYKLQQVVEQSETPLELALRFCYLYLFTRATFEQFTLMDFYSNLSSAYKAINKRSRIAQKNRRRDVKSLFRCIHTFLTQNRFKGQKTPHLCNMNKSDNMNGSGLD